MHITLVYLLNQNVFFLEIIYCSFIVFIIDLTFVARISCFLGCTMYMLLNLFTIEFYLSLGFKKKVLI